VATITRPWIGRRSRLDGPRRQRGRRRRAVVGQGRARYRVLGGALAGRTVPACSSSCSGGWTSSNAQGGSAPGPGSRAAATLVTGAAGPPTPTRILPGSCRSRWPPWAPARGWAGPSRSRQVKARSWGWRVATSTVTGPKDGQRRVVTPDRPPVRNAGRRTSATFHLDPWPGAGPGAWSAASGPPGGRSAAQDQLGGPGILASRRVAGIGWWTASPARGAKLGVVGHVRRGPHRRHRRPGPPCGPGARRGQRPGVEPGERCSAGGCRAGRRTVSMLRMAGSAITIRHARPAWLLSQGIIVATAATWRSSGPWILPTWPPCLVRFCSNRPPATQRPFPVVCNATAVGCVAMGVKRDPAVRLCVTCVQLESADQFAPGRRKCVACQQTQPSRADCPGRPHDPHAAVRARAQDQALRRLGLENLDAYRTLYQAERRAVSEMVPPARARKQTVSRALRALERQHHSRYVELYQARSQPHSRRPGRPAGTSDRLTITPGAASTWRRPAPFRRRPRQQGEGARQRAELQAIQERAADLFAQGVRPSSVAGQLDVARAVRGQLARPLAKPWDRSVAQPWPQPQSRDSRQEASGDRTGAPQGGQGSRL
jgi:hypothetical protein